MSLLRKVEIQKTPLGYDAWNRNKAIIDKSLLHGMFTFDVPKDLWKEQIAGVEQTSFINATSIDGKLNLQSSVTLNEVVNLSTFRSPRYQPNRGHIFSTSCFLPSKNALGSRKMGTFTEENGDYFELDNGVLYAVRRTTVASSTSEIREVIDLAPFPDIDLEKGNTFDIQKQWRGVGDIKFFINQILVFHWELLGTLTDLSTANPASPLSFECVNQGDQVVIQVGCVDVSSEGGTKEGGAYGSVGISNDSGQVSISGLNVPIIAIRSKLTKSGILNTQDTLALLASAYGDQRCVFRVWATRDFTAITENDQAWGDFRDGHLEYIEYDNPPVTTAMTFDTTKAALIFTARVDQDNTYATSALFEGRADIYITHGDMFVFTMHRETAANANVGVTFEFSEEA